MAVILRTGIYGDYYGNETTSSNSCTKAQMETNALYIYNSLTASGWSLEAIAGILGNMQSESSINPGRWQGDNVGDLSGGYGCVQWTPATKYINYIKNKYGDDTDYSEMDYNMDRINYEVDEGIQWISTPQYLLSFDMFKVSNKSPEYLAGAFLYNYERPASYIGLRTRQTNARRWYEYLGGRGNTLKKKKFKWFIYSRKLRERYNEQMY